MQASSIPAKFQVPFGADAVSGTIRTVPLTSGDPLAASLTLGFPIATFNSPNAPDGRDVTGILNASTSWDQWFQAGGPVPWDGTFSSAATVNGYAKGACVQSATQLGVYWYSTVDNNTTNPDSSGAGWVGFTPLPTYGADAGTANAVSLSVSTNWASLAKMAGQTFTFKKIASANTSTMTMSIVTPSAGTFTGALVLPTGVAMASGYMPASLVATVLCDGTKFILISWNGVVPSATPQTSLCWAICQGTSTPGAVTIIDSSGNVTVTRTSTSGQYTIAPNFTIGNGFACPMPDNTNSLAGWGTHNSGPSGTTFTFGFENRGGGGSLDPTTFFVEINGGP